MTEHLNPDLLQLVDNVERWAHDRNLIAGATVGAQFLKLVEETAEQQVEIHCGEAEKLLSETGDAIVVAIIMSAQMKQSLGPSLLCAATPLQDEDRPETGPDAPLYPFPHDKDALRVLGDIAGAIAKRNKDKFFAGLHAFLCITINDAVESLDNLGLYPSSTLPDRRAVAFRALTTAWKKIKHRKGQMVNGVFVKEGDL